MPYFDHITIAVPAMAERETLPRLLECLRRQTLKNFVLNVCVNQPREWWELPLDDWRRKVCDDNQQTIEYLSAIDDLQITILDYSNPRHSPRIKDSGVGRARRILMGDAKRAARSPNDDIIVSLDADTTFGDHYLETIIDLFNRHHDCAALSLPYYHPLDDGSERQMLRYECYMRHYLLQMLRIGSPYAFTALGAAMAFTLRAYGKAGGYSPLQAGEDFYLMQKFAKTGRILLPYDEAVCVYPSGRTSRRVPFGTGPAVSLSLQEMAERYPFYSPRSYDDVAATYSLFPSLYAADIETPMTTFLRQQLATDDLWGPLRKNYKRQEHFVRACTERVDGLRILQYLKSRPYPDVPLTVDGRTVDFAHESIEQLNAVRDSLFRQEMEARKANCERLWQT